MQAVMYGNQNALRFALPSHAWMSPGRQRMYTVRAAAPNAAHLPPGRIGGGYSRDA